VFRPNQLNRISHGTGLSLNCTASPPVPGRACANALISRLYMSAISQ